MAAPQDQALYQEPSPFAQTLPYFKGSLMKKRSSVKRVPVAGMIMRLLPVGRHPNRKSLFIFLLHFSAHFCGIAGGFARWQQRPHGGHPSPSRCPSNGVSSFAPGRSAAIQQQRLAGAEHHGGGLCAAEKRPSPLSTPIGTAGRSSKRPLLRISTTTTTAESN